MQPKNVVERTDIIFALNRQEREISWGEQRLAKSSHDEWAKGKKSTFYYANAVESTRMDTNFVGEPRLTIIASRKNWKFLIQPSDTEIAIELASRLASFV